MKKLNKELSCGVFYTDGKLLLGCHATNGRHNQYDIPKGHIEIGETTKGAAMREMYEETGIKLFAARMISLGDFTYRPNKDLFIYLYKVDEMPDIHDLKCTSYFDDNKELEIDYYRIISFEEIEKYFYKSLQLILLKIVKDMII